MRRTYKQRVREFVKGGRAALVNHSLDEGLRLKDARNRPSVDPNCELSPQGPIIPVPPSSSPHRPVGHAGIIGPFPQVGCKKKTPEPEGSKAVVISLVALLYSDAETASGGTRQHQNASSEVSSRYPHSMASVLPSRHSSCTQFLMPSQAECRQVTPCRVSSASETKAGTTSKTHFKLSALSFRFCPKGRGGPPLEAR